MKSGASELESSSPFPFAVTRIAVSQICRSVGFKSAQNSALSTITDVAIKYLQAVAAAATTAANTAGRTESNVVDIAAGLEYLHSVTGFSGGSNVNLRFYDSGPLFNVMKFVKYKDETPFAKPLPPRCLEGRERIVGMGVNERNGMNHIPKWLPVIPEIGGIEKVKKEVKPCLDDEKLEVVVEGRSREIENVRRELPLKRWKVKFKIGMGRGGMGFSRGLKSGNCVGGKRVLGKRVFGQIWSGGEEYVVGKNKGELLKKKKKKL